ncbi:MAG: 2Fe-2S iron-sulfur cluster-binding protein [Burkholderiales bacterium]
MPTVSLNGSIGFECATDDTLLRAALRAGLGMPYECNVGSCGTCKVELIGGEVTCNWAEAPGLSARDKTKNRVLACQSRPLADCGIKARLQDHCRPVHRPRRFRADLIGVGDLTHDMREFRFRSPTAPAFEPGQYALLELPGVNSVRAYSMSNLSNASGEWHFLIKRMPNGLGSAALFEKIEVGSSIEIDGPYGMAYLRPDSVRDLICIAGGSGLSPMISIARGMAGEPKLAKRSLHFFYGGRGPADLWGDDMLATLPGYGERIHFTPVISMPQLDTGNTWSGAIGFVHEHVIAALGDRLAAFEYYFAGPPAMTQAVQAMLVKNKVPFEQLHYDSFY